MHIIAIAQHAPVFLDQEATLKKAVALIREAADQGVRLIDSILMPPACSRWFVDSTTTNGN